MITNHEGERALTLRRWAARTLVVGAMTLCLDGAGYAAPLFFTDRTSFDMALPGPSSVINFDGLALGTPIPTGTPFQGIAFTTNLGGLGLAVSNIFATTSGTQSLGVTGRPDESFLSGDELTFDFASLVQAFGLSIVGRPGEILANDLQLVAAGGSLFNSTIPQQTLSDGGEVYFLGVVDSAGFPTARLNSFGDPANPFFSFKLDDLSRVAAVSEPRAVALLGLGLLALGIGVRRSRMFA